MKRLTSVALSVLVITSLVAMVPLGTALAQDQDETAGDQDETAGEDDVRPGERLSGVVGVQAAEIDGEVEARSFGIAVAQAESNEERAELIAQRLDRNQERLDELQQKQERLHEHRDNETITQGTYQARMAQHAASVQTINRTTNQGAAAAAEIPAEVRAEHRIDAERLQHLRTHARNMTGPEVAEMARGIAGPTVGGPMGPPEDRPGPRMTPDADRPDADRPDADRPDVDRPVDDRPVDDRPDRNRTHVDDAQPRGSGPNVTETPNVMETPNVTETPNDGTDGE